MALEIRTWSRKQRLPVEAERIIISNDVIPVPDQVREFLGQYINYLSSLAFFRVFAVAIPDSQSEIFLLKSKNIYTVPGITSELPKSFEGSVVNTYLRICFTRLNGFSSCMRPILHNWGMGFQILLHTQARRPQSWMVVSLSASIGVGIESFDPATLNRKT